MKRINGIARAVWIVALGGGVAGCLLGCGGAARELQAAPPQHEQIAQVPPSRDVQRPQGPVSKLGRNSATVEWNSLLRQRIDSMNERNRGAPGQLAEEDVLRRLAAHQRRDEELAKQFLALAEKADPPLSYMALEQVLTTAQAGPAAERAAEVLIAKHLDHRSIHNLVVRLSFSLPASLAGEQVLRAIIEKSTDREVVALASVGLGRFLCKMANEARMISTLPSYRTLAEADFGAYYVGKLAALDTAATERETEELLLSAKKDYADVAKGIGGLSLQELIERELICLRCLIGRPAQEIVGVDVRGQRFALSDHQGKVRVLMFWGHWCGPCRKGYPTYRAIVDRYADRPFAFLAINSDKEKSTLEQVIATRDVTWQCWWDGGEDPMLIHKQWALIGAPHIFVLDRNGTIRFTDVRGKQMEEAIELLMAEQ